MNIVWQPKIAVYYKKIISRSISLSAMVVLQQYWILFFCTSQCFLKGWFSSKAESCHDQLLGHCFLRLRKKKLSDQIYLLIIRDLDLSPELIHRRLARLSEWRNYASQMTLDPNHASSDPGAPWLQLCWAGAAPYGAEKVSTDCKKSLFNSDSKQKKTEWRVQLFSPGLIVTHSPNWIFSFHV